MQPIEFIAYYYYSTAYYCFFLLLSWLTTVYYLGSNTQKIIHAEGNPSQLAAVFLTLVTSFFLGLRQLARDFGDTINYANGYQYVASYDPISFETEWLWNNLEMFCKNALGLNVHEFFVVVALIYFLGMLICAFILTRHNLWVVMLFFFTAFSTYQYGTNGIRNGLSCSLLLIAIAIMASKQKLTKISAVLMFLAMGIHRSSMLPIVAVLSSVYFIKDTKTAFRFWLASIAISLVAGPSVEGFFASLGFDDRMAGYHNAQFDEAYSDVFSRSGFRWDFLLYSVFPVVMIWYVTRYRKFHDPCYNVIANTYLFCNAFWIMVIRAAFSNRFAYLSWFIYPMVMAYPLMRMNIWKTQDRKTAIIFFLYSGFTFFMFFIYYFGTTGFKGFDQYWWR